MTASEHSPDVERLLEQSGWARALALRLVGDASLADDVVQDALVAALERPPQGPGLREWFGVVVRNLALRRKRREAARGGVERRAARREAVGTSEEALQRLELQRRLAELVLALAEPYRSAVVLRHVEGRSAREIAARQGCSEETARQRVARGLTRLRAELDRQSGGDRGAWCGAFVALHAAARDGNVVPAALTGGGAAWIGGALVGAKSMAAVAAVTLTLGGAAWWLRGEEAVEPARPSAAQAVAPTAAEARGAARDVVEPAPAAVAAAERDAVVAVPASSETPRAHGRALDARGLPLAGVEVALLVDEGDDVRAAATSDGEGRFAFADPGAEPEREWRLLAQREGFVPLRASARGPDLGDLVLVERPRVTGVVLRPDGSPAAPPGDVSFHVLTADGETEVRGVELDARGRFTSRELVPGRLVRTQARARGFLRTEDRSELELAPGSHHELVLTVDEGAVVRGTVLDERSEQPVPFAEVWADGWTYDANSIEPSTVADAQGRFELRGVQVMPIRTEAADTELAWVQVSARAEGYLGRPFEPTVVHEDESGGFGQLVLKITRADAALVGRLTWPDGSPAAGVTLYGLDAGPNFHFETSDGEGRFAFEGLHPGPFHVCARSDAEDRDRPQGRGDAHVDLAPGAREELELVIALADGSIRGRVVDSAGRGLEGVAIEAGEHMLAGGLTMGLGQRRTTTDAEGRYVLEGLGPGRYQVELSAPELREHAVRPSHVQVDLEAGRPRDDVDFVRVEGVDVAGWVDVGDGDPTAYRVVRFPLAGGEALDDREPDGEGRFRFEACWPEACALVLRRGGEDLARVEVGAAGAEGIVLTSSR